MITVEELLEIEKKYNEKPIKMVWNEEEGLTFEDEENYFLRKKPLSFHLKALSNRTKEEIAVLDRYDLTEAERLILIMFEGDSSNVFQDSLRNRQKPTKVVQVLISILDSLLLKAPKCTAEILYRQDNYTNLNKFKVGEVTEVPYFLNTSLENWDSSYNVVWKIFPSLPDLTKARCLYPLYNHGDEKQVTFERDSKFLVFDIKKVEDEENKHIVSCVEIQ